MKDHWVNVRIVAISGMVMTERRVVTRMVREIRSVFPPKRLAIIKTIYPTGMAQERVTIPV